MEKEESLGGETQESLSHEYNYEQSKWINTVDLRSYLLT